MTDELKFGAFIRERRRNQEIGLRKMAKRIGVSPSYLSMIECDECAPPIEERVRNIATVLDLDPDELLALAGKVSSDLTEIIRGNPRAFADFLRTAKGKPEEEWARLCEDETQKAYEERNRVVALLATIFPSGLKDTNIPGWDPEWHGCVYIDFPWGQASWHFHDNHRHLVGLRGLG